MWETEFPDFPIQFLHTKWGELTLSGHQDPTKLLSLYLLSRTGEENTAEKLMGGDKDRETTHQLLPQVKQTWLQEN